ncbi:glycoside hydrolase family 2 protein [Gracilibacillus boraciitolerans]|nr:glycoside hydrolase family 2 protein [Gracilibacillus boraciitolerans]
MMKMAAGGVGKNSTPGEQREVIWKAYDDIFHHILPDVVEELDPTTDYWPSSPMQDLSQSKAQHATFDSLQQGDIHYWDVWHGLKPLEEYKKYVGRFMSEYGFQSFPEKKTVLSYAEENDLELESEVMLHHQKNGDGNRLIKNYMQMYYKDPKDFSSFLYLSQTLQADAIKSAIEAHRLNKPFCMGTLYWQLNDCWPVASWASMDYYGRWKALQYTVKDRYKDIALIIDKQGSECNFYIVSDILDNVSAELTIKLFDRNGNLLYENKELVLAGANTSTLVKSEKVDKIIQYKKQEQPIVLRGIIEANKKLIDAVDIFFEPIKDLTLEKPNITYELIEEDGVTCAYLKSEKLAKDVWLETDKEGYFSENKFNLIPGEKKKIHFFERSSNVNSPHHLFLEI